MLSEVAEGLLEGNDGDDVGDEESLDGVGDVVVSTVVGEESSPTATTVMDDTTSANPNVAVAKPDESEVIRVATQLEVSEEI